MKDINIILALVALTITASSNISAMLRPASRPAPAITNLSLGMEKAFGNPAPSQNVLSGLRVAATTNSLNNLSTKSVGSNKAVVDNTNDVNVQGEPTVLSGGSTTTPPGGKNEAALNFANSTMNSVSGGISKIASAGVGSAAAPGSSQLAVKTGALSGTTDSYMSNSTDTQNNQAAALASTSLSGLLSSNTTIPYSTTTTTADPKTPQNINIASTQEVTSDTDSENSVATEGEATAGATTNNTLKLKAEGNTGTVGSANTTAQAVGPVEAGTVTGSKNITAINMQQNRNSARSIVLAPVALPSSSVSTNVGSASSANPSSNPTPPPAQQTLYEVYLDYVAGRVTSSTMLFAYGAATPDQQAAFLAMFG